MLVGLTDASLLVIYWGAPLLDARFQRWEASSGVPSLPSSGVRSGFTKPRSSSNLLCAAPFQDTVLSQKSRITTTLPRADYFQDNKSSSSSSVQNENFMLDKNTLMLPPFATTQSKIFSKWLWESFGSVWQILTFPGSVFTFILK